MTLLSELPGWAADHGLIASLHAIEVVMAPSHLLVVGLVLAGACLLRGQVRAAVFVSATMVLTSYATTALKSVFGRERPAWQWAEHLHQGGSFPSGHSSASAALVGVLVVLASSTARGDKGRRRARLVAVPGALLMAVVGADRILLGRHYPTDVLAGWLLAACMTAALGALLCRRTRASERPGPAQRGPGDEQVDDRTEQPEHRHQQDVHELALVGLLPLRVGDPQRLDQQPQPERHQAE